MKTTYSNTKILQINHIHLAPQLLQFPVLTGSTSLKCETELIYLQNLSAAFSSDEAGNPLGGVLSYSIAPWRLSSSP